MEVTIKGQCYKVRYSLRALFIFEKMAGKPFELKTAFDFYIFYYSMLLANNPDCGLSFDDFIDCCDGDPGIAKAISAYLEGHFRQQAQMSPEGADVKKKEQASPSCIR